MRLFSFFGIFSKSPTDDVALLSGGASVSLRDKRLVVPKFFG